MKEQCVECGQEGKKRGWTNCTYCSEQCERNGVSRLHGNMPGAGPVPRHGWVPSHISDEISRRWKEE